MTDIFDEMAREIDEKADTVVEMRRMIAAALRSVGTKAEFRGLMFKCDCGIRHRDDCLKLQRIRDLERALKE